MHKVVGADPAALESLVAESAPEAKEEDGGEGAF